MKFFRSKDSRTAGFSLLELIVVIAIITLLAGILTPLVKSSLDDAKVAKTVAMVDAIKKAATKYYYDNSSWGTVTQMLVDTGATTWKGPYLDAAPATSAFGGAITLSTTTVGDVTGNNGYDALGGIATNDSAVANGGAEILIAAVPFDLVLVLDEAIDGPPGAATNATRAATGYVEWLTTAAAGSTPDVKILCAKQ